MIGALTKCNFSLVPIHETQRIQRKTLAWFCDAQVTHKKYAIQRTQ